MSLSQTQSLFAATSMRGRLVGLLLHQQPVHVGREAGVAVVDQNSRKRLLVEISGKHRQIGEGLLEIFVDDAGFIQRLSGMDDGGDFACGIDREKTVRPLF